MTYELYQILCGIVEQCTLKFRIFSILKVFMHDHLHISIFEIEIQMTENLFFMFEMAVYMIAVCRDDTAG